MAEHIRQRLDASSSDEYYNLGSFHRQVSTKSKEAQLWFDRGLIWSYAFNHEEAARCFERAIVGDPNCAMAYWGLAYSLGPNYNKPWESFEDDDLQNTVEKTSRAVSQARENMVNASPVERSLIIALEFRYPEEHTSDGWSERNQVYAAAMKGVYANFPDDLDVAALYIDALMNLTPWQLWNLNTGEPSPNARTLDAKQCLDHALALDGGLRHPGLLHLYIHLMEMSPRPDAALSVANHLRGLVPDAGHLEHMPTHLDVLCGDYQRAITSNSDAIKADEKFLTRVGPLNFYTLYRTHDYHFRMYAAMFAGQSKVALDTVTQLEGSIPEELLRVKTPSMADWLEAFLASRVHVLIRFGRWPDVLGLGFPSDRELYCVTTAMIHYAKGIAFAATSEVDKAKAERDRFHDAIQRVAPTRTLFNNKCTDILAIASAMLDGEIEYRSGNFEIAFDNLRKSIALDDALPYDEPWGWMQPTRHAYGALLLEQNHLEESIAVYEADLGFNDTLPRALRHPNNVWSLHGYHECLAKLGRTEEARLIEPRLRKALTVADIPIKSSCFCRLADPTLGADLGSFT